MILGCPVVHAAYYYYMSNMTASLIWLEEWWFGVTPLLICLLWPLLENSKNVGLMATQPACTSSSSEDPNRTRRKMSIIDHPVIWSVAGWWTGLTGWLEWPLLEKSNTKASEICCEVKSISIGFDMLAECKWWLGGCGFEAAQYNLSGRRTRDIMFKVGAMPISQLSGTVKGRVFDSSLWGYDAQSEMDMMHRHHSSFLWWGSWKAGTHHSADITTAGAAARF